MTDYRQMYLMLFNSITDALNSMDGLDFGAARRILEAAQQKNRGDLYGGRRGIMDTVPQLL